VQARFASLARRRRVVVAAQVVFVAVVLGSLGYAVRDVWSDALPRLRDADVAVLLAALGVLAAYYFLFVVGWQWILGALGPRIAYRIALQAEMASMLAKYVPGGVWTPLARILWLRRAGVQTRTSLVLSSILLEAGLSAVSGVLVFVASLAFVDEVDAPLVPLLVFAVAVAVLLHPRVFTALARALFPRFGAPEPPRLSYRAMVVLLVYYSFTWLVGGAALYLLLRSVDSDPGLAAIPYLGGTAAVGAIVAVLSIIAPSGLGVREASMYGLMIVVVPAGAALGATVLNRLAITVVEAALLAGGVAGSRLRPGRGRPL
jgi:glycosyltransferase 2 family protein